MAVHAIATIDVYADTKGAATSMNGVTHSFVAILAPIDVRVARIPGDKLVRRAVPLELNSAVRGVQFGTRLRDDTGLHSLRVPGFVRS